jgi:aspartyl-tRNA(Asn)/glutamyl-tRNA(Gln) amidotransferase subunit C
MTKLGKGDSIHVAKLARLDLTPTQIKKFQKQLGEIISYVDQLNEVETKDVKPTSQTTGLINVLRKDKIDSSKMLSLEQVLSGSEKTHNNYFSVDALIRKAGK